MKKKLIFTLLLVWNTSIGFSQETKFVQDGEFQLASPSIESDHVFFDDSNQISILLNLDGANIHYTLDGSEPTEQSPIYSQTISIQKSTNVRAKAFHPDFLASETHTKQFFKLAKPLPIKNIQLDRTAHENYLGGGPNCLVDRIKGSINFRSAAWMGFDGGDLEAVIEFDKKTIIQNVLVSSFIDLGSWIFLPEMVDVYCSKNGKDFKLIGSQVVKKNEKGMSKGFYFTRINFNKEKAKYIKIKIKHIPTIPDWHSGKGKAPWLFLDEIVIE